jgi:hypothetical protein
MGDQVTVTSTPNAISRYGGIDINVVKDHLAGDIHCGADRTCRVDMRDRRYFVYSSEPNLALGTWIANRHLQSLASWVVFHAFNRQQADNLVGRLGFVVLGNDRVVCTDI